MTDAPTPTGEGLARAWFEHSPFIGLLGLRLESITADEATVEMPFRAELATAGDLIHGGALAALLDTAAALAAWSAHDPADGTRWGTISMSLSFLAGGRGQTVRARARVSRRGKTICYCRVELVDDRGSALAEGLIAYRLGS